MRIKEPKPFKPIELEQAFGGAYRSYRINGKPKLDVDMKGPEGGSRN